MGKNRVFFPQAALDQWISDGKVDLTGDELTIKAEARRYRITEAARVVLECHRPPRRERARRQGEDASSICPSLGAEILEDSMVLGDNAYDVVPGFLAAPVGFSKNTSSSLPAPKPDLNDLNTAPTAPLLPATKTSWRGFSSHL